MSNIFSELNKQVKESKERWTEINKLAASLKAKTEAPFAKEQDIELISLVLLLVEQLRPLQATPGQAENMQKEINDMLGSLAELVKK